MSCSDIAGCIGSDPTIIDAIAIQLINNELYQSYLTQFVTDVSKTANNIYPAYPTSDDPDLMCNAATYIVSQLRSLMVSIYSDLAALTPEEVLASILGLFGWRQGPLYQLIGVLQANDQSAFLADYDAAAPDLICKIIEAAFDQTPVINWIATEYPFPSVIGDALTVGIQSLNDTGKWSQWISVGSLITAPDCGCPEPLADCVDFTTEIGSWELTSDGTDAQWYDGLGVGNQIHNTYCTFKSPAYENVKQVTITFNQALLGATDFDKAFFHVSDYTAGGEESFGPGNSLLTGNDFVCRKTDGVWGSGLRLQAVFGGLTWKMDDFITMVCVSYE
jgi:hypothetical protein